MFWPRSRNLPRRKSALCQVDPSLFLAESKMGGELQDKAETIELIQQLQEAGAVWVGRTESLDETIQPRLQANIHKEDFSEELLSKSTRQAIRTARNKAFKSNLVEQNYWTTFQA